MQDVSKMSPSFLEEADSCSWRKLDDLLFALFTGALLIVSGNHRLSAVWECRESLKMAQAIISVVCGRNSTVGTGGFVEQ